MSTKIELNKTLEKHLKAQGFSLTSLPNDLDKWQTFIARTNNFFNDIEQELYILERSSEIASREIMVLNKKLMDSQHLAKIVRCHYNKTKNKMTISKEFYEIFDLPPSLRFRTLEDVAKNIHYHDKNLFIEAIQKSLSHGIDEECEVRLIMPDKRVLWLYILCHPLKSVNGTFDELTAITMDITKRKEAEEKISDLNQKLVIAARDAGMAEIATGMLHNLGNILNSANVSLDIIKENISEPYLDKALLAINLMKNHISNLDVYLKEDEKGKLIPQYLIAASSYIHNEYEVFKREIANLDAHLTHIKEIVFSQQKKLQPSIVLEKVFLPEIIELALKMCATNHEEGNTKICKKYEISSFVETDRSVLLQILVNLIHNAKEAIRESKSTLYPEITITVKPNIRNQIEISIKDNGVGIPSENRVKIFSFGFTSKKRGHGYGLHSSALFAKELGGDLQMYSDGYGKGATFILTLPANRL